MGRWTSPLVMHYAGDAMAGGIASDLQSMQSPCSVASHELLEIFDALAARIQDLEAKPPSIPAGDTLGEEGAYICNLLTSCWHYTRARPSWPAEYQRANCGWFFMYTRYSRQVHMPGGSGSGSKLVMCKRCRPHFIEHRPQADLSDIE